MRLPFPHVLLRTSSRHNPDIRVVREWGGMKLLVNGSPQSGPYIKKLWERAFGAFRLTGVQSVRSILVLGLGGGTVIEVLATLYPRAEITAVDTDQTMIDVAKKYFHLGQVTRLSMLCADASKYVSRKKHFDLIVVDLFIGREIPGFVAQAAFYQRLKKMLLPHGVIILNYLRELTYQQKSDVLFGRLKRIFSEVRDFPIANNRFFFCRTHARA